MIIEESNVLTLSDGNEYVVVLKINKDNLNYFFLIDTNNDSNVKFCYQDNDELVEIEEPNKIRDLVMVFGERAKQLLPNDILEKIENQDA